MLDCMRASMDEGIHTWMHACAHAAYKIPALSALHPCTVLARADALLCSSTNLRCTETHPRDDRGGYWQESEGEGEEKDARELKPRDDDRRLDV